jgi:hypothetical protein
MDLLLSFFTADFLGKPAWLWFSFLGIVLTLLAFDLGILHKDDKELGIAESLKLSVFYIAIAVAFGAWVWWSMGATSGMQYFTGYAIEKALSIDNVFVISLIFGYFAIPPRYQYRALVWGIVAVLVLRGFMIGIGAALVQEYDWVLLLFGAFLVATGVKMLSSARASRTCRRTRGAPHVEAHAGDARTSRRTLFREEARSEGPASSCSGPRPCSWRWPSSTSLTSCSRLTRCLRSSRSRQTPTSCSQANIMAILGLRASTSRSPRWSIASST